MLLMERLVGLTKRMRDEEGSMELVVQKLTRAAFAPYGEVIAAPETPGRAVFRCGPGQHAGRSLAELVDGAEGAGRPFAARSRPARTP